MQEYLQNGCCSSLMAEGWTSNISFVLPISAPMPCIIWPSWLMVTMFLIAVWAPTLASHVGTISRCSWKSKEWSSILVWFRQGKCLIASWYRILHLTYSQTDGIRIPVLTWLWFAQLDLSILWCPVNLMSVLTPHWPKLECYYPTPSRKSLLTHYQDQQIHYLQEQFIMRHKQPYDNLQHTFKLMNNLTCSWTKLILLCEFLLSSILLWWTYQYI